MWKIEEMAVLAFLGAGPYMTSGIEKSRQVI